MRGGREGGLNVFKPQHFMTTSCNQLYMFVFIFQLPRRREANISFLYEVGLHSLFALESVQNWVTACCFEVEVCWGKWLCAALVRYHRKTIEPPVRGKTGQCAHATVCSPLFGYCGGGSHITCYRHTTSGKDTSGCRRCASGWCDC